MVSVIHFLLTPFDFFSSISKSHSDVLGDRRTKRRSTTRTPAATKPAKKRQSVDTQQSNTFTPAGSTTDLEAATRAPPGSRGKASPRKLLEEENDNEKNSSSSLTLQQDEVNMNNAEKPSSEENESGKTSAINSSNLNSINEDTDKPQEVDKNTNKSVTSESRTTVEPTQDRVADNEPKRKEADSTIC